MSQSPNQIPAMQAIRDRYLRQLPDRVRQIDALWSGSSPTGELARDLYTRVHSLKGSGATFGFPEVTELAAQMEALLDDDSIVDRDRFSDLIVELRQQVDEIINADRPAVAADAASDLLEQEIVPTGAGRRILIVDDDTDQGEALKLHVEQYGYQVEWLQDYHGFGKSLERFDPDIVLMDIVHRDDREAGLNIVKELRDSGKHMPPVIFLSARDDVHARLRAIHAGGSGYFVKPVDVPLLVDVLDRHTIEREEEPYRVLIVDSSVSLSEYYASVLKEAGMQSRVVNDPQDILGAMSEFNPELVVTDMYMGEYNGIDIVAMLRQDEQWLGVPVVFLSSEVMIERQLEAMKVGADEFLTKPINDRRLVASISMRVERYRRLRMLMERDSLTGLFDHSHIKERLDIEVGRSLRHQLPLVFVMIDIDHFKQVNDTYGHAAGDRVIKNMARMLTKRLRTSDVVGRYGGEEFAVILTDTGLQDAENLMNRMREHFASLVHESEGQRFTATLSCGIADYPGIDHVKGLLDAADAALYQAKEAGRNRVICARAGDQE